MDGSCSVDFAVRLGQFGLPAINRRSDVRESTKAIAKNGEVVAGLTTSVGKSVTSTESHSQTAISGQLFKKSMMNQAIQQGEIVFVNLLRFAYFCGRIVLAFSESLCSS